MKLFYLAFTGRGMALAESFAAALGGEAATRFGQVCGAATAKAVEDYIDDNLEDKSMRQGILELVDSLVISTIDILKSIIDEVNIHGEIPDGKMLNIPKADYHFDVIRFKSLDCAQIEDVKAFIIKRLGKNDSISGWLRSSWGKKCGIR